MRAVDLFKIVDLVYRVVVQAGLAEAVLVLAVGHVYFLVFLSGQSNFSLANLASNNVLHSLHSVDKTVAHQASQFGSFHLILMFDESI